MGRRAIRVIIASLFVVAGVATAQATKLKPSGGDDTAAIQAAFTGPRADGEVIFAEGDYLVSRPIRVNLTRFVPKGKTAIGLVRGAGKGATIIRRFNPAGFPADTLSPESCLDSGVHAREHCEHGRPHRLSRGRRPA
jgi:hypothetical protein